MQKIFNIHWNSLGVKWLEKSYGTPVFTKCSIRLHKIIGKSWASQDLWTAFVASHCPLPPTSRYYDLFDDMCEKSGLKLYFSQEWLPFSSFHPLKIQTSICKTWTLLFCNLFNIFSKEKYKKYLSVCREVERTSVYEEHLYCWQ